MKNKFDIFISYRHQGGGFETANLLHDRLTQAGYSVFMDVENLRSGKFNEQLFQRIDECRDVLVVLGPNSLDRCENPSDWVRMEVAHAIRQGKNIVPVFLRGFEYPKEPLPADMAELLQFEGIEASPQLFDAFLGKLRRMLLSKRRFSLRRYRNLILSLVLPLLVLSAVLLFIHFKQVSESKTEFEQACTQVVSEISAGFANSNDLLEIIQEADKKWKEFHQNLNVAGSQPEKLRLKKELLNWLEFEMKQIESYAKKYPELKLTEAQKNILTKNGISVQDIKAAPMMFQGDVESTHDFLRQIKYWLTMPERNWPDQLDEAIGYLKEMNFEMIDGGIYSLSSLMIEMPEESQIALNKFIPMFTNYTVKVDLHSSKETLEALQQQSIERCERLLGKYDSFVGNMNMKVEVMKNNLDSLKSVKKKASLIHDQKLDSMRRVVATKKVELEKKEVEVSDKEKIVLETYDRIIKKSQFETSDDQWKMWGKVIYLANFASTQLDIEDRINANNEQIRQNAIASGQDPNKIKLLRSVVSSKQVFAELQGRLDQYLLRNKAIDPNAPIYVTAAKVYYQQVADRKLERYGVIVVGTENNQIHPLLKSGDIVLTKKGEPVKNMDVYFGLNKKQGENIQTYLRLLNGKLVAGSGTIQPDNKVLIGVLNLWDND